MRSTHVLALGALVVLATSASGALTLLHTESSGTFEVVEVEVPYGPTTYASSVGPNATNASVSLAGSLLETTTDILYLNNTNTTGAHYARLEVVSTSNLGALDLVTLGIDNGTSQVDQVIFNLGSLTQTTGTYVKLEPGSSNTVYVSQTLGALGTKGLTFWTYSADDPGESAYVKTRGSLTLT